MFKVRPFFGLLLTCLALGGVGSSIAAGTKTATKPNIVFILADDLGWRDLAIDGSPWHRTPHLDRLASQSLRFTHAYAPAPICSASRSAFLTGRSPARLNFEFVTKLPGTTVDPHALKIPPYPLNLPLSETTVGELLRDAGYRTGLYGKWHVSAHNGGYLHWSDTHGPRQQGFAEGDQEFGSHPYHYRGRNASPEPPLPAGDFGADALTDKAIGFMRRHRDEPFLLWLAHYYVHTPIDSRAHWLEQDIASRLPADADPARATYGAMVETLDELVGRVLRELDDLGLAENTLVIFTSDNGGHPQYAANGPARGSKWNTYEGGLRVPFMVRWPGRVPAGQTDDTPIIGTDLLPTLAAVADITPDAQVPLDGVNLLPLWERRGPIQRPTPLVWHFPYYHPETDFDEKLPEVGVDDFAMSRTYPQSAIRSGDYKLIHFYEADRDELYDLATDPGEQHDLSRSQPERVGDLRRQLDHYLSRVNARLPTPL
ncbi:sulfatase [Synoicihabitans lomoniglobus]|uniref:Sulfatase n=1 Tax=Synoicihabitans lomoniglobus TaxID=2909285 RepID=A0AAE9ZUR5_9BACT|nr:sulfatase [Opitutaceae bacterium LMO-M01]WED63404.1 sulfatase [Opitutaceae bacterium LMO-M01]